MSVTGALCALAVAEPHIVDTSCPVLAGAAMFTCHQKQFSSNKAQIYNRYMSFFSYFFTFCEQNCS